MDESWQETSKQRTFSSDLLSGAHKHLVAEIEPRNFRNSLHEFITVVARVVSVFGRSNPCLLSSILSYHPIEGQCQTLVSNVVLKDESDWRKFTRRYEYRACRGELRILPITTNLNYFILNEEEVEESITFTRDSQWKPNKSWSFRQVQRIGLSGSNSTNQHNMGTIWAHIDSKTWLCQGKAFHTNFCLHWCLEYKKVTIDPTPASHSCAHDHMPFHKAS